MWRDFELFLSLIPDIRGTPPVFLAKFFFLQVLGCMWLWKQKRPPFWAGLLFLSISSLAIWVVIVGKSSCRFFSLECVGWRISLGPGGLTTIPDQPPTKSFGLGSVLSHQA
jgi:hypothetical protein